MRFRVASVVLMVLSIVGLFSVGANAYGQASFDESSPEAGKSSQWQSRRAPGKWVPVSGTADEPVPSRKTAVPATGKVANKTGKPSRSISSPPVSRRKTPAMVFIAGKSAAEEESGDDEKHPPSDDHGHSEKSTASSNAAHAGAPADHGDSTHESDSTHHGDSSHGDSGHGASSDHDASGSQDHKDQSDDHGPTYFDAPLHNTPDQHADESTDGDPVISSTERFKQMLMQHHGETQASSEHGPVPKSEQGASERRTISSLPPSIEADLRSDDPMRRQRAARFLKLREKLLQLKARASSPPQATEADAHGGVKGDASGDAHEKSNHTDENHPTPAPAHSNEHDSTNGHSEAGHGDPGHEKPSHDEPSHGDASHEGAHHDAHGDSQHATEADAHASDAHAAEAHATDTHSEHPAKSHPAEPHDAGTHAADTHHAEQHVSPEHETPEHGAAPEESHQESHEPNHDGHETAASHDAHLTADSISDPIDRVSLGNNLYALGEYPAAHKAYLSVNPEELTAEQQIWTEYQIANCLRRLGETAEASNRFRKIAAQPEAGWLSERAAWWVGVLEQMRRAESALTTENAPEQSTGATKTSLPISRSPKEESHDNAHH